MVTAALLTIAGILQRWHSQHIQVAMKLGEVQLKNNERKWDELLRKRTFAQQGRGLQSFSFTAPKGSAFGALESRFVSR